MAQDLEKEGEMIAEALSLKLAFAPERIEKGWSHDIKYKLTDLNHEAYLLRLLPLSELSLKQKERQYLNHLIDKSGFSVPFQVGTMHTSEGEKVYTLSKWLEGEDAEDVVNRLSQGQQYRLGTEGGRMLKAVHDLPFSEVLPCWEERYAKKVQRKIELYQSCGVTFDEASFFMRVIDRYLPLIKGRPTVFMHGDFHLGNMVVDEHGNLGVIDFNRYDFGDPYDDFNRMMFTVAHSAPFASGLIDGYFEGQVPDEFWGLMFLYHAVNQIGAIPWAIPYGEEEVETMKHFAREVANAYESIENPVPRWYVGGVEKYF